MSVTSTPGVVTTHSTNKKLVLTWVADGTGAVAYTSPVLNGVISPVQHSNLVGVSNQWSMTLTDASGTDLLAGNGANLSGTGPFSTPTADANGNPPVIADEPLTLTISGAGAGAAGNLTIHLRP